MPYLKSVSLIILVLSVAACQKPSDADGAAKSGSIQAVPAQSSIPQPAVTTTKGKNGLVSITPGELATCQPAVVTIDYDLSSHPEAKSVSVFVQSVGDSSPKLLAQMGVKASVPTGPWAQPGLKITLEDSETHAVFDEVAVSGPQCQ